MKDADKPKRIPQLYDFVNKELDFLRDNCNFSEDEMTYFNLRAKHYSNLQISLAMNVSEGKVSKLAKSVKQKIVRVL